MTRATIETLAPRSGSTYVQRMRSSVPSVSLVRILLEAESKLARAQGILFKWLILRAALATRDSHAYPGAQVACKNCSLGKLPVSGRLAGNDHSLVVCFDPVPEVDLIKG